MSSKTSKKTSAHKNTANIVVSVIPPLFILQPAFFLPGQNGTIPSLVKLSANICKKYPKKKGKARTGMKNARIRLKTRQAVRL